MARYISGRISGVALMSTGLALLAAPVVDAQDISPLEARQAIEREELIREFEGRLAAMERQQKSGDCLSFHYNRQTINGMSLPGRVDEGYRRRATERYAAIINRGCTQRAAEPLPVKIEEDSALDELGPRIDGESYGSPVAALAAEFRTAARRCDNAAFEAVRKRYVTELARLIADAGQRGDLTLREQLLGEQARVHRAAQPSCGMTDSPPATFGGAPVAGLYDTSYGQMSLTTAGGTYEQDGGRITIKSIKGNVVEGVWEETDSSRQCEDGSYRGRIRMTLTPQGFTGRYGYCDDEPTQGRWDGTRVAAVPVPASAAAPAPNPSSRTISAIPAEKRPAQNGKLLGTVWTETEGGWSGRWTRRGSSNSFDAVWTKGSQQVKAALTIDLVGNQVTVHRQNASDGNNCEYAGKLSGNTVSGSYRCSASGGGPWRATIDSERAEVAPPSPVPANRPEGRSCDGLVGRWSPDMGFYGRITFFRMKYVAGRPMGLVDDGRIRGVSGGQEPHRFVGRLSAGRYTGEWLVDGKPFGTIDIRMSEDARSFAGSISREGGSTSPISATCADPHEDKNDERMAWFEAEGRVPALRPPAQASVDADVLAVASDRLEAIVAADSRGWKSNKYVPGSMTGVRVVAGSLPSSNYHLRGIYTYNDSAIGWVIAKFVGANLTCLQYHDMNGECRKPN